MAKHDPLTERQRAWLTASWEIGRGPMTRSEKRRLQKLYDDMSQDEQVGLQRYIQEQFGAQDEAPSPPPEDEPTVRMERKQWPEPSSKLLDSLSKAQTLKPPSSGDES